MTSIEFIPTRPLTARWCCSPRSADGSPGCAPAPQAGPRPQPEHQPLDRAGDDVVERARRRACRGWPSPRGPAAPRTRRSRRARCRPATTSPAAWPSAIIASGAANARLGRRAQAFGAPGGACPRTSARAAPRARWRSARRPARTPSRRASNVRRRRAAAPRAARAEPLEAVLGERVEQRLLVGEVPARGGVADARPGARARAATARRPRPASARRAPAASARRLPWW